MRTQSMVCVVVVELALSLVGTSAHGQEDGEWTFELTPLYLWIMGGETEVTHGGVSSKSDFGFSDIIDDVEFAITVHFEATNGEWSLFTDLSYTELGRSEGGLKVDVDMFIGELGAGVQVSEEWQVIFGGRWFDLDIDLKDSADPTMTASGGVDWVDPFVGVRTTTQIGEKWWLTWRADIGGFSVGSDVAWNMLLSFDYVISNAVKLRFAARVLDFEYDTGTGDSRTEFDATFYGPLLGVTILF